MARRPKVRPSQAGLIIGLVLFIVLYLFGAKFLFENNVTDEEKDAMQNLRQRYSIIEKIHNDED